MKSICFCFAANKCANTRNFLLLKKKKKKIRQNNMECILGSHSAVWKNIRYKTISWFLRINQHFSRQINVFAKEVTRELISRIFFSAWLRFAVLFHTVTAKENTKKLIWRIFFLGDNDMTVNFSFCHTVQKQFTIPFDPSKQRFCT